MLHPLPILAALACAGGLQAPPRDPMLAEVVENVLAQPVGPGTVADLALPPEYVEIVAERILQGSFAEHFRMVVTDRDPKAKEPAASESPSASPEAGAAKASAPADAAPSTAERERPGGIGLPGLLAVAVTLIAILVAVVALRPRRKGSA